MALSPRPIFFVEWPVDGFQSAGAAEGQRVAVLLSLLLQVILIFVGPMRKRTSHPVPRFAIWACYLLADWVADLALGLLLNNLGNIGSSSSHLSAGAGGGPPIFAFWTPFLLLHLGGPDTMTAYSVDDNELWRRHLIGLLFELFSALRKPVSCSHIDNNNKKMNHLCCWHKEEKPHVDVLTYVFDRLKKEAQKFKGSTDYDLMKKLCGYRGEGTLKDDEELVRDIQMELTKATREELSLRLTEEESSSSTTKKKEAEEITHDVLQLADKKKKEIDDLVKEKLDGVLRNSIEREFDESLLLWHIATDLCCHRERKGPTQMHDTNGLMSISETLSEYMLYLLVRQPEMLSATAGIGLLRYRDTCAEARRFFKSAEVWDPNHDDARRMLLSVNTSKKPADVKGDRSKSVLFDACILAKVLRELDYDTMWRVVAGVWREMLTYAAGKCQGSTHVRQLSRGGELITMAWFLMAHTGMGDVYRIAELAGDPKAKLIIHDQ
uniref:DUF4220 domain-containing protein n=1 Tax=Oryza nivara TaxID=4536 RepID=A0A0E0FXT4_ORYNI